ncbi:MAG: F0F1 ATP synthase subunit epsilon [Bacteroidales bacterium]|nr:F0F1 ATP synthase subunit epsilon [Bacteroidales bacterium]
MKIKITKPDATLFEGDVKLVQLPGTGGKFEMLENHAPIISSLAAGDVRIVLPDGAEQKFAIRGGVVKGQKNELLLLVQ